MFNRLFSADGIVVPNAPAAGINRTRYWGNVTVIKRMIGFLYYQEAAGAISVKLLIGLYRG